MPITERGPEHGPQRLRPEPDDLILTAGLHSAVAAGDLGWVEQCLASPHKLHLKQDGYGRTALEFALARTTGKPEEREIIALLGAQDYEELKERDRAAYQRQQEALEAWEKRDPANAEALLRARIARLMNGHGIQGLSEEQRNALINAMRGRALTENGGLGSVLNQNAQQVPESTNSATNDVVVDRSGGRG